VAAQKHEKEAKTGCANKTFKHDVYGNNAMLKRLFLLYDMLVISKMF
jgi:hypothetical protein